MGSYTRVRNGASVEERLRFHGWTVTDAGCWGWNRSRNREGYGFLWVDGVTRRVHRLAYETWVGPIPEGLLVRHKCDNPPCMNPEHLELGNDLDNAADRESRGRGNHNGANRPYRMGGHPKLTDSQIIELRQRYTGEPGQQTRFAAEYGISQQAISRIVRGETWTHIKTP